MSSISILEEYLDNITPSSIHSQLCELLPDAAVPKADALLNALKGFGVESPKLHCARCHSTYSPFENGPRACTVQHNESVIYSSKYNAGRLLSCCRSKWPGSDESDESSSSRSPSYYMLDQQCFEGLHTANPEEVEYNGHNIWRCERSKKCRGIGEDEDTEESDELRDEDEEVSEEENENQEDSDIEFIGYGQEPPTKRQKIGDQ